MTMTNLRPRKNGPSFRLTPNLAPSRTGATQVLSLSTASDASVASLLAVLAPRLPRTLPTPRPLASSSACTTKDSVSPASTQSSPPRHIHQIDSQQRRCGLWSHAGCRHPTSPVSVLTLLTCPFPLPFPLSTYTWP